MTHVFVIDLTYTVPLKEVKKHLEEHRAYLSEGYASGTFLASGRKEPRTGGVVILAQGVKSEIESIISRDPFSLNGIAKYSLTEFIPTMTGNILQPLKE